MNRLTDSRRATLIHALVEGSSIRAVTRMTPPRICYIETDPLPTSTPGLRGQSGGPTFDTKGTVFAIQSRTQHFPLGFDTYHGEGKKRTFVPQFINVGWGVHVATVTGFLAELGVAFAVSNY